VSKLHLAKLNRQSGSVRYRWAASGLPCGPRFMKGPAVLADAMCKQLDWSAWPTPALSFAYSDGRVAVSPVGGPSIAVHPPSTDSELPVM
jgi:hypothetical protein